MAAPAERAPAESNSGTVAAREMQSLHFADLPASKLLAYAAKASGRGVFEITREHRRLKKGPGRLTLREYVTYGLYDTTRYSPEDQMRFLSRERHWPITHTCCDMTWQATTEDKFLCSQMLESAGLATPETVAIIDRSIRRWPGTTVLKTADQMRSFFQSADLPLFGKVNRGMNSAGAALIEDADNTGVYLRGVGLVPYDTFLAEYVGAQAYILQPLIRQHHFFDRYTSTLPTIRVCVMITDAGVRIPWSVLKLPASENIADSFRRPGNVACAVEPSTGRILSARTRDGIGLEDHQTHPGTGAPFAAEVIPYWPELWALVEEAALIFAPVRYQSMDVAITEDGPVMIEVNTGGGFDLPQCASGEGFLSDEVVAFFRSCGVPDL